MFLILLFALLCTAPLSLVKWRLTNYYDDDDDEICKILTAASS